MSVYFCKHIFHYQLSPKTLGYTPVRVPLLQIINCYIIDEDNMLYVMLGP